jgi:hypothetical protein
LTSSDTSGTVRGEGRMSTVLQFRKTHQSLHHMVKVEARLCADIKTDVLGPTAKACKTSQARKDVGANQHRVTHNGL